VDSFEFAGWMNEIAAVSVGAETLLKESDADFGLIFAIHLIVLF